MYILYAMKSGIFRLLENEPSGNLFLSQLKAVDHVMICVFVGTAQSKISTFGCYDICGTIDNGWKRTDATKETLVVWMDGLAQTEALCSPE